MNVLLWLAITFGVASWGYFDGQVVTRYPAGTPIMVCSDSACWSGYSAGYGPAWSTGRIVDLDRSVFELLCGDPGQGLCDVALVRRWAPARAAQRTPGVDRGTSLPWRTDP